jgi:hypothetical protein
MMCTLSIRLSPEGGYMLRVSGQTALGQSGTGGRDGKHYSTVEGLYRDLDAFGLGDELRSAADLALSNQDARKRFIDFAERVQIPFESLESADIYLFD